MPIIYVMLWHDPHVLHIQLLAICNSFPCEIKRTGESSVQSRDKNIDTWSLPLTKESHIEQ